jgi:hypothetical protein
MPPTGGFGLNTGVQDVHNLCWKLALVLQGKAEPSLLKTYHDERQPVGRAVTEQSLNNAISMGRLQQTRQTAGARPEYLNEIGMIFGATYESAAIIADGSAPSLVSDAVTQYLPSARPGGRAPHAWLHKGDGARVSTIDLVGDDFLLLAGAAGEAWLDAAQRSDLPVKAIQVGRNGLADIDGSWHHGYGVEPGGAVLVRPDGYVAWRSAAATKDPSGTLGAALARLQGRD